MTLPPEPDSSPIPLGRVLAVGGISIGSLVSRFGFVRGFAFGEAILSAFSGVSLSKMAAFPVVA